MPALSRDAVFDALRQRRHYGTTGTRMYMSVKGTFERPVARYLDDPALGPTSTEPVTEVTMGAIVANNGVPMRLTANVIGNAPIDRIGRWPSSLVEPNLSNSGALVPLPSEQPSDPMIVLDLFKSVLGRPARIRSVR